MTPPPSPPPAGPGLRSSQDPAVPGSPDLEPGLDDPQTRSSGIDDSEHNPSLEGLGSRLRQGAKFASVALIFTQLISLLQTVVIARLLTPLEIGTFTLGTLFATFLTTMADGGMRAALIQREKEVEDAANTAFWVSLVTGSAMALAALAAAPLLSLFFDDRLVGLVCAATCGTLLIHSLLNVPEALMQRRFNFKRRLIVDPTTATTFAVVAVTFCALGFGVWGMVIGLYASQLATLIACWVLAKWRPGKGTFTFRIWREMAGYAAPLILSGLVDQAREAVQAALVGRRLDVASAGQYRYGRRIGILPGQAIIQVASYVLFPAFARIAEDLTRFRDGMIRALQMLWIATTPFAAMLVALGQPIIVVLLGEQWRPAGLFVAAMAGAGPGVAMGAIGIESIKGAGASRRINYLTALSVVVGLGALVLLLPYGLLGVGLAASIDGVVGGIASLLLARSLAGVSIRDLVKVLVPPVIAAALAGSAVWFLERLVVHADQRPVVIGALLLALEALLLVALFVGLLFLMAPDAVRALRDGLLRRTRRGEDDTGVDDDEHEAEGAEPIGVRRPAGVDRRSLLDAPTEVLPLFALDGMTEQVYSPYRRMPPPPRRPQPVAPPMPAPRPPGAASTPTVPMTAGMAPTRAGRFREVGLDAPTTAIPPVRDVGPGGTHTGRATEVEADGPRVSPTAPLGGDRTAMGTADESGIRDRRIVRLAPSTTVRRKGPDPAPPDVTEDRSAD